MDNFLMMLEGLDLSQWVLGSIWGYPIFLTFHSVGLGLLVGLLLVIDLRLLGFVTGLPLPSLSRLMPWVWLGFTLNAVSGVVLFIADARKDYYAITFRLKILAIVIGLVIGVILNRQVLKSARTTIPWSAKALAWASILSWAGAIVSGRLIAYLDPPI